MIGKPIDQITEQDLQALIDNKMAESRTIEYKQTLPGNSDADKKEFLADVSSFANAEGGDLIYGITENPDTREPQSLDGLDINNIDETKLRLDNIVRDGISPRIVGIASKDIHLQHAKIALIIRIPKRWNSPHRVIYQGHDKFYTRWANGKYSMDVTELRTAFTLAENITERMRSFRLNRLTGILSGVTPVPLLGNHLIVLHILPIVSFSLNQRYDIDKIARTSKPKPMYCLGWNNRYNMDGFVAYAPKEEGKTCSYVQLYRTGILESVETRLLEPEGEKQLIPSIAYEREIITGCADFISVLNSMGVVPPIVIFLTLLQVKNYKMAVGSRVTDRYANSIDRDVLDLQEVVVGDYGEKPEQFLRPIFDSIWNACGFQRDLNYNDEGEWAPPR